MSIDLYFSFYKLFTSENPSALADVMKLDEYQSKFKDGRTGDEIFIIWVR